MRHFKNALRLSSAFALAAVLGCTSSPTEPSGGGGGTITPKPPDPVVTYVVTVTANPGQITAGGTASSNITVDVRRSDNGQPPPDLTPVTLTTNLGSFGSANGPQSVQLQLVGGRAQAVLFAGADAGTATVRAVVNGSAGATNVGIGQPATFFVSSVDPSIGSPQGGEQVTILGGGFESPVRVTFNGAAATVRSVSPNRIVVVTPSAAAAGVDVGVGETESVNVEVTINVNETNEASDTIPRGFTYALGGGGTSQPQVFSVTPASGTNDGGTRVTIVGDGFQAPVQVFFGLGASATSFNGVEATVESVTPTRIVAITPAARGFGQNLTNQVVDVLVKNVNTGFSTIGRQQFKYGTNVLITAMGPGSGLFTGGTRVTISGQGFDDPVAVSLGGIGQGVISVSGTEIVFVTSGIVVSQCPQNGIVTVTGIRVVNIETGDFGEANLGFNYTVPLPQILSISPTGGSTGSLTTISGIRFAPNVNGVQVTFGNPTTGSSATVKEPHSDTSIDVTVPRAPQGFTFNTQPCGTNGTRSVATPIDITVRNVDTGCSATFRNGFLLNPEDTTCNETLPPPPAPPVANFNSQTVSGNTVQFTDTSTGNPTSWQWDFTNDGTVDSTLQHPQFTYPSPGNYPVRLKVSNAGGMNETVKVITVP